MEIKLRLYGLFYSSSNLIIFQIHNARNSRITCTVYILNEIIFHIQSTEQNNLEKRGHKI